MSKRETSYQDQLLEVLIEIKESTGSDNPELEEFLEKMLSITSAIAGVYGVSPDLFMQMDDQVSILAHKIQTMYNDMVESSRDVPTERIGDLN